MSKIRKIVDVIALIVTVSIALAVYFTRFVPRTLVVPDEYKTIQEAINKAKKGETVLVKAGIYEERIRTKGGIRLIGEERDKVLVKCEAKQGHVILVAGYGGFIKNLTVEQTGKEKVDPRAIPVGIYVYNGSVEIVDCRVSKTDGCGMIIQARAVSIIRNCIFESSRLSGIYIVGQDVKSTIENCTFQANGQHGIYFDKGAGGTAKGNICRENRGAGIYVCQSGTSVTLTNNHCRNNGTHGIWFNQGANGLVKDNLCENNSKQGILISATGTKVNVNRNSCRMNKENGILLRDGAKGVVEENVCEQNGHSGIYVSKPNTTVTVSGNSCRKNETCGIYFEGPGQAIVKNNICSDNIQHGLKFTNGAQGLAENNICFGNHWPEILVNGKDTSITFKNHQYREN